jgi:cytochrome c oxidase cbb3-type subunit 4
MNYETLRHFADSYGLLFMVIIWAAFAGWAFRPGARERNRAAARMIFKDDDHG